MVSLHERCCWQNMIRESCGTPRSASPMHWKGLLANVCVIHHKYSPPHGAKAVHWCYSCSLCCNHLLLGVISRGSDLPSFRHRTGAAGLGAMSPHTQQAGGTGAKWEAAAAAELALSGDASHSLSEAEAARGDHTADLGTPRRRMRLSDAELPILFMLNKLFWPFLHQTICTPAGCGSCCLIPAPTLWRKFIDASIQFLRVKWPLNKVNVRN